MKPDTHLQHDVMDKLVWDPVRAANAIILAVASGNPPHHLLLGNNAIDAAMAKLDELRTEFTAGEAVARAADFPKPKIGAIA